MLRSHRWRFKYTPEDGDLVDVFYIPALQSALRHDRLTGYFNAGALALAARGIEGLVRNAGRMRLVVGCTLEPAEIEAINKGERLRTLVEQRLISLPLEPRDAVSTDALELLAWMIAHRVLEVKVAVPCDADGAPTSDNGIFHEKTGIVEDRAGDRIAWTGSLNETNAGWQNNWESISVFTSWGAEPGRVDEEETNFSRIWEGRTNRVIAMDIPEAMRLDLMRFMPKQELPARLRPTCTLRDRVWSFIRVAPSRSGGGECIGEATAAVTPWPHQVRAFERLYKNWPPKLLIADEVGLGKTIQAGLLLRQAWLAGRARRILILAPKAVLSQWQIELYEKFNLNWPIYDGGKLVWYESRAMRGQHERKVEREEWHREPVVLASSQLMRRRERASELLERAEPWDLVVLDEAHHARRRAAGSTRERGVNALLKLMQGLTSKTGGLLLLTATPMQVHPVEVWDLLSLLGLPPQWTAEKFLEFFEQMTDASLSAEAMERMAHLFRAAEQHHGAVEPADAERVGGLSRLRTREVLKALRDSAVTPRKHLQTEERQAAVRIMRANTPVRRLVSRYTRETLRGYFQQGMIDTPVATREVQDRFLVMSDAERGLYEAVEDYIVEAWGRADRTERSAVGFVMTIYRRRLASSFHALRETLGKRRDAIVGNLSATAETLDEDLPDDDAADEVIDADEAQELAREALACEQRAEIDHLIAAINQLPPNSKLDYLTEALRELRTAGYKQVMIFTQYTDTMDFLRAALIKDGAWRLLCFSGRGGEVPGDDGTWSRISRNDAKQRFRNGDADVLLCTDAAAEGLNFQFCGALINYDMPWNPMRVEQRIGRIDRLGQEHKRIRIINMHYDGTVETDIYRALGKRIQLFTSVVGPLQPILARLPGKIGQSILTGQGRDARTRASLVASIEHEADESSDAGFDINAVTQSDLDMPARPKPILALKDLERIIGNPDLMPSDVEIEPMGRREYSLRAPGMTESVRVTTDPEYFEQHAEDMELWSPGNLLFQAPELTQDSEPEPPAGTTLKEILDAG